MTLSNTINGVIQKTYKIRWNKHKIVAKKLWQKDIKKTIKLSEFRLCEINLFDGTSFYYYHGKL